jgi:hypothetical protein
MTLVLLGGLDFYLVLLFLRKIIANEKNSELLSIGIIGIHLVDSDYVLWRFKRVV